jgi:CheY-like chemotaxis protein
MGTLLLVGEGLTPERNSAPERSPAGRGPSLKGAFERVGYHVVYAENAAGALARLRQGPPDLIVLAGTVPDMDLLDLCAAVRREPAVENTPFVVVAEAPTEIAERLRRLF